ncbi:MAG TPA: TIGR01906 family membrane protein [Anaerolineae bacterium]|nr:TIGR01906 family membrane protein [Anaerolineae bacterium]HRJ76869.1 TIGR01906 family membrane protein [Anaerolineales bacterium]
MKHFHILSHIISLLTPLALIGLALRILLTPLFYTIEYNMPYFPEDTYGFNKEDRLKYAPYAVDYLINNEDISYLGDLTFDDGSPLYNERELSHMEDVKEVITGSLTTWYITLAILLILFILFYKNNNLTEYLIALQRGGWWMIGLALSLAFIAGAGILLNPDIFWTFFSGFHAIFFEGDSWLFYYSDTLIRLFPIRFWQDAVIAIAVIALGGGLGLALGLKRFTQ